MATLTEQAFLDRYGTAVLTGNASVLVGAGLSRASGYPDWNGLMEPLRERANISPDIKDLPLVAQYFEQSDPGGRPTLLQHLADHLGAVHAVPGRGHHALARLPIRTIWTTNYDSLLEMALPTDFVPIIRDADLRDRTIGQKRIIKMHGNLTDGSWTSEPVITRADFENYEPTHLRMSASLRATYLTQAMLFLGFSFDDPNIEVLLRLARTSLNLGAPEHFTIMRRPGPSEDPRAHQHRVTDLRHSNVDVLEIDDFSELDLLLVKLVRRTREPRLFVSGSTADNTLDVKTFADPCAHRLADYPDLQVASLGGPAGTAITFTLGEELLKRDAYNPDRLRLHFRRQPTAAPPLERRIGTAIYSALGQNELRREVMEECRAVLVLGGGSRTAEEVALADELDVPVIPLGSSGGAAADAYRRGPGSWVGSHLGDWAQLDDPDPLSAAGAVARLVAVAMHLQQD